MNITNQFRRRVRVVESTYDLKHAAIYASQESEYRYLIPDDGEYPVILTISVQVRICFVWVTVWSESCDVSDGDTRQHIVKRANKLHRIMEGKEHG